MFLKYQNTTSSSTRMLLFWQRNNRIIFRESSDRNNLAWEIYLYDTYPFVVSLIINLTFHGTLYLIQNKWSRRLEKGKDNINVFLRNLDLDAIYNCFIYFIFNILSSSCISVMYFISVLLKLSIDLRP